MSKTGRKNLLRPLAFLLALGLAAGMPAVWRCAAAGTAAPAALQLAQYNAYPPPGYYPPPARPPCAAYGQPFRGAARGAAGGAIIGGIAGNAGKGAAIGAGVGMLGGAIRNSNARANGYCY